jgi:hypothetical protein
MLINSTYLRILSPDNLYSIYVANTGLSLVANGTTRMGISGFQSIIYSPDYQTNAALSNDSYTIDKSSVNKLTIDNIKTSLNYDDTNYVSINNSNIYLVKNNGVRTSISDNVTNTFSPSGIMNTVQADVSYTISGGGSTGPRLIMTPTDLSFNLNNITRIHSDSSHTQLISPDGLQAIEANNNGVQINLGTNNYKLPTTRGTVGQVLTYSGINTTWTTSASSGITNGGSGNTLLASTTSTKGLIAGSNITISTSPTDITINATGGPTNAGFSLFNPLLSTGVAPSGTKSYWYIVMVPCNTVLNGFKTILSSGSDPFKVAVYRGRTNSSFSYIDLVSPTITPVGGGFYSGAFTVYPTRSNVYTAGEYITVMYHSQGSTNSFYNNVGPADVILSYTTSTNYANSTPPTSLYFAVLGTNVNRLAIEFY